MDTSSRPSSSSHGLLQVIPRSVSHSAVSAKSFSHGGSARGFLDANAVLPPSVPPVSSAPSTFAKTLTKSKSFTPKGSMTFDKPKAGVIDTVVDDASTSPSSRTPPLTSPSSLMDLASLCRRMLSVFVSPDPVNPSQSRTATAKLTDVFEDTDVRCESRANARSVISLDSPSFKVNASAAVSLAPRVKCPPGEVAEPRTPAVLQKLEAEHAPWAPKKSTRPASRRFSRTPVPFGLHDDGRAIPC